MLLIELYAPLLVEDKKVGQIQPGEVYKNDKGQTITNVSTHFFPDQGSYETDPLDQAGDPDYMTAQEKTEKAIVDAARDLDINLKNIRSTNKIGSNKAAMLSVWKSRNGKKLAFLRYATKINRAIHGIGAWNNSDFKRDFGYTDTDEKTQTEIIELKPSDYFDGSKNYTTKQILETVRTSNNFSPEVNEIIYNVLLGVVNGSDEKVPGAAAFEKSIQKYLSEIAAPLAMLNPSSLVTGDYEEAGKFMMPNGGPISQMKFVSFPSSKTEPLIDSSIQDKITKIGISSKSKTSIKPPSINAIHTLLSLHADQFPNAFLKRNKQFIDVVEILATNTNQEGPFKIGLDSGYISEKEIAVLRQFMKDGNPFKVTQNMKRMASYFTPKSTTTSTYNVGYHILAGLAAKIAQTLNEKNPTPFFKAVLSTAGFVQVVSNTSKGRGALAFSNFHVIYPGAKATKILFDANSNYYSTGKPKDKMSFKMV